MQEENEEMEWKESTVKQRRKEETKENEIKTKLLQEDFGKFMTDAMEERQSDE